MPSKLYTAREAANVAHISHATLYAWLSAKKIDAPTQVTNAGVRLWTDADITRLKRVKKEIYQEGHPRKRRAKKQK